MLVALPRSLESQVAAFAKDVREATHKGTAYLSDEDGRVVAVKGAYGNSQREAFAYNQGEAKDLRTLLRKAGYTLPLDAVEGLLCEALAKLDGATYHNEMPTNAERQKRVLADRKAKGWCSRCPSYLARPALPGKTLCDEHATKEVERVAAWRKRRRSPDLTILPATE